MRTCVGCRGRAVKSNLLRVVALEVEGQPVLHPDPAHRLPGRGASIHPSADCVDLAEKRRAFPRALRLTGPLDLTPVRVAVTVLRDTVPTLTRTGLPMSRTAP